MRLLVPYNGTMIRVDCFLPYTVAMGAILSWAGFSARTFAAQDVSRATRTSNPGATTCDERPLEHAELTSFRVLASLQGTHGRLQVLENSKLRILACDGVIQTAVPTGGEHKLPGALIRGRDYVGLIPYYRPRARDGLLIGLGAGLHVQSLEPAVST